MRLSLILCLCILTACSARQGSRVCVPVEFVNCDAPKSETPLHAAPLGQSVAVEDDLMITAQTSKDIEEAEMQHKIDHLSRMKRARKTDTPEFQENFSQLKRQKTEAPVTRYVSTPPETTVAQPAPQEPKIDEDEIDIIGD